MRNSVLPQRADKGIFIFGLWGSIRKHSFRGNHQLVSMGVDIPDRFADVVGVPEVEAHVLPDDGPYPNNESLPLLVYGGAVRASARSLARTFENVFAANNWTGAWRDGIFPYHHYHSTTHEVLGVAQGSASVQLGGPDGIGLDVAAGDVLVLPAGVAHKNCGASSDFLVVGAYPDGRSWDLMKGRKGERPQADQNIQDVPLPGRDPIYGASGPLQKHWANHD